MENRIIVKMAESKVNFVKVLTPILEANPSIFRGSDFNLKGATCKVLESYGFIRMIDRQVCWYKVDEDTMKRGFVKRYCVAVTPLEFVDIMLTVKDYEIKRSERKLDNLARKHRGESKILDKLLEEKAKLIKLGLDMD